MENITNDNFIFCKHCGTKIPSDSMFCENCGKKIIDSEGKTNLKITKMSHFNGPRIPLRLLRIIPLFHTGLHNATPAEQQ